MDRAHFAGLMVASIQANGRTTVVRDKVSSNTQKEAFIRDNLSKTEHMEKEYSFIRMDRSTRENGGTTNLKEWEL